MSTNLDALWKGIKPCPKCGKKVQCLYTDKQRSFVYCWDCHHHGPERKREGSAIEAWDKQARGGA